MMPPKSVTENNKVMSEEIKAESLQVKRSALWNKEISDQEANVIINAFNKKWLAAGGSKSSTIVLR